MATSQRQKTTLADSVTGWVIERTFSWIIRWRRLCRDHEGLPSSSEALIKIAMSSRMLHLLKLTAFSY